MKNMSKFKVLFLLCIFQIGNSQSLNTTDSLKIQNKDNIKFKYTALILPAALMTYGIVGIESDDLKFFNEEIREEVLENIDTKFTIDDFSQFAPATAVYGLNFAGIKGKNNLKDRSIILATSYLMVGTSVYALKNITKIERPDGSSNNSFPSGHTATAFAGAEFLWQEYKDVSVWYGISGYVIAAGTGAFRIYNNRHWFTDVVMGAGIGILSTKAAYWLFPIINNHIFHSKNKNTTFMMAPIYTDKKLGMSFVINL